MIQTRGGYYLKGNSLNTCAVIFKSETSCAGYENCCHPGIESNIVKLHFRCPDDMNIETGDKYKAGPKHQNVNQELQSQLDNQRRLTFK